jgi:hypothetical protein
VVPILCFLTFVGKSLPIESPFDQISHTLPALDLRTVIFDATLTTAETVRLDSKAEVAEIAIQATITMLCTVLISLYLIFRHLRQRKLIGKKISLVGLKNSFKNPDRESPRIHWIHERCCYAHRVICT